MFDEKCYRPRSFFEAPYECPQVRAAEIAWGMSRALRFVILHPDAPMIVSPPFGKFAVELLEKSIHTQIRHTFIPIDWLVENGLDNSTGVLARWQVAKYCESARVGLLDLVHDYGPWEEEKRTDTEQVLQGLGLKGKITYLPLIIDLLKSRFSGGISCNSQAIIRSARLRQNYQHL